MDEISTWAKENFDLISLLVGVIGVVIGFISLIYEMKKKKVSKNLKSATIIQYTIKGRFMSR